MLKETDARSFLGSSQSSLFQRVREICRHERLYRQSRLDAARHTFHEHEALKKDAELPQSQDHFAEDEEREQSVRDALAAKAEAALRATNTGTSPLLCATAAAPYLPHLRASRLLEFGRNQTYVSMNPATRVDLETIAAISSPKMLSTCAENFIFENSVTLTSEYPDRLRLHFPPPPATSRSVAERLTSLMASQSSSPQSLNSTSPSSFPSNTTTTSPFHSARRRRPTSEAREDQRVLDQQLKRLYDAKMQWDTDRKDFVLLPPPAKSTALAIRKAATAAAANVNTVRPTPLHQQLKATQETARKLVEEHLRKVSQRQSEAVGQTTFLHFF